MAVKVLIFSRDAGWHGGVVNFVEVLKEHFGPDVEASQFLMGRRKGALGKLVRPFFPILDAVKLMWIVIQNPYDVYHLNPSLNGASLFRDGLFLVVLRMFGRGKVLVCFHGWENSTEKMLASSELRKGLFRRTFGSADKILVLAQPFRNWLIDAGLEEGKIGLYTTMFDDKVIKRRDFVAGKDDGFVSILFLSRLVVEKGVFELLEAFRLVAQKHTDIKLLIAGAGPAEESLKLWVEKNNLSSRVEFLGYVRGEDKADVLNSAQIFALPSYTEGCPVSLLEAMAAGMAVITTPVGGIPDIVCDGKNGILINGEINAVTVGAALEQMLMSRDLVADIGRVNQEEAWERYQAPIVTRHFEEIYAGL
jgi:glycosyltransferase involved in cell wall biosynthesis